MRRGLAYGTAVEFALTVLWLAAVFQYERWNTGTDCGKNSVRLIVFQSAQMLPRHRRITATNNKTAVTRVESRWAKTAARVSEGRPEKGWPLR